MVLVVARCLQEVFRSLLSHSSRVSCLKAKRVHTNDAILVFTLDFSFFLVSWFLRELIEVIVRIEVSSPFLRHEETRIPLLLLTHKESL